MLTATNGLFRYNGTIVRAENGNPGNIIREFETPEGLLFEGANGWFLDNGTQVTRVGDYLDEHVFDSVSIDGTLILGTSRGLLRYAGQNGIVPVDGDDTGGVMAWFRVDGGLLLRANKGLFFYDGHRIDAVKFDGRLISANGDYFKIPF